MFSQFFSTWRFSYSIIPLFFSSGPESSEKKKTLFRDDGKHRVGMTDDVNNGVKNANRMSKKYTFSLFGWMLEKNGLRRRKRNNEEREKNRPDGNCNNITLDQTHIHILNGWFGIFFLAAKWCEANHFSCWFFFSNREKRVISGWIAEAAECDGCWMRGREKRKDGKANCRKEKTFMFEFHFLFADQ